MLSNRPLRADRALLTKFSMFLLMGGRVPPAVLCSPPRLVSSPACRRLPLSDPTILLSDRFKGLAVRGRAPSESFSRSGKLIVRVDVTGSNSSR